MRLSFVLAAAMAAALCSVTLDARADEPDEPDVDAPPSSDVPGTAPFQAHLDVSAGVSTLGVYFGALGLARIERVELGATIESTGLLSSKVGGGALLGIGGHDAREFGWDVLLEGGLHEHHVAGALLSDDHGATASIAYGGIRVGFDWRVTGPDKHVRFVHGLWLFANMDLESKTKEYGYGSTNWFSGQRHEERGVKTLGGQMLGGIAYTIGLDGS